MRASLVRRAAVLASAAALVVAAAPARADQPPAFTTAPVVAGPGVVGAPMRVVAQWSGVPAPVALYEWERCDAAGLGCDVIDGACSESYVPTFDDFGQGLAVRVELWNSAGAVAARTPLSDLILGAPTAPVATARASMACTAVASPGPQAPAPVTSTAPSPAAGAPAIARVAYMRPFPIVRIRGYFVRGGARITLLSVRGPPSARVRVACTGAGCPRRRGPAAVMPPGRLRAFERFLPAGTVLRVRVTGASAVGKYTSFRIRAHGAPARTDRCLLPGRWAPARCPAP